MKKIASRVLALVVALSMLLASTAFAAERNAATLTIGNFELTANGETISLPVYLSIGGGVDIEGARGYASANLSTESAVAVSALGAFENGEIKAYLNGMNYGFTIPLEQIVSLLEAEMGMSLEDLIAEAIGSIDEETMTAITDMANSAAALESVEIDQDALLNALGVTMTEKGEVSVTLFDVEAAATEIAFEMKPQTYKALFDALAAADPAMGEYLNEYFSMMNETLAATGEEMTIEEAFSMITIGLTGTVYDAGEAGALIEMTMTLAVEGETVEAPLHIVTLTDEAGTYAQVSMSMDIDGESVYLEVYADDYAAEDVDYTNISLSAIVGDTDAEESDVELGLSFSTQDSAEFSTVGAELYASDYGEVVNLGLLYAGSPVVSTAESDSYGGMFEIYGEAEGTVFNLVMDTNLTLSNVPAGELLTFTQSVNPLEADEETMAQVATDATNALIQGLGVLMQDPTIASMLGGLMG